MEDHIKSRSGFGPGVDALLELQEIPNLHNPEPKKPNSKPRPHQPRPHQETTKPSDAEKQKKADKKMAKNDNFHGALGQKAAEKAEKAASNAAKLAATLTKQRKLILDEIYKATPPPSVLDTGCC